MLTLMHFNSMSTLRTLCFRLHAAPSLLAWRGYHGDCLIFICRLQVIGRDLPSASS